jgi:hypothetical protein
MSKAGMSVTQGIRGRYFPIRYPPQIIERRLGNGKPLKHLLRYGMFHRAEIPGDLFFRQHELSLT